MRLPVLLDSVTCPPPVSVTLAEPIWRSVMPAVVAFTLIVPVLLMVPSSCSAVLSVTFTVPVLFSTPSSSPSSTLAAVV